MKPKRMRRMVVPPATVIEDKPAPFTQVRASQPTANADRNVCATTTVFGVLKTPGSHLRGLAK